MGSIVRMTEILTGMSDATLIAWRVAPGDEIAIGTPLAEIETDKATIEYPAETAGLLAGFLVGEGATIAVGTPVAVLAEPGETAEQALAAAGVEDAAAPEPVVDPVPDAPAVPSATAAPDATAARQFISPLVRRLARERNLDLIQVRGSGPNGRIVKRDIFNLESAHVPAASAPAAAPQCARAAVETTPETGYTDTPVTRMRRAIAQRLTESKSTIPHFYLDADCRVDALLDLRRTINEHAAQKISLNDFVIKAVAAAFAEIPSANSIWVDGVVRQFEAVDIGVAVAVDGGLVTPVVRDVGGKSLSQVSAQVSDYARRGRDGQLKQHELQGGAFCISNLGMFGTERFSAIINPPQSGILAVGAATPRPIVTDGKLSVATVMSVTLSGDHRVYDGAVAAQWLAAFVRHIERPLGILI